ncbi:phospho-N-acetylmuramoyl-pentapeptide-transferase [Klebsormidium nitens]|uniref:Phospho-N-acetylmuramoyl-pentapeptide-transferase n=1 Tax=Klebsormidium nitens TaxID=105231 RepID=A0A1Y1IU55_KLENI|nr:phospho-N-acetylmuramoyl-pentapeptide-transferase [Klebsormidium nitens]|eukprot:GAQ93109.1 phospho-N-acetylmuramoyl-pentapeptide-transferase [Klebsormidium nitens]
MAGASITAQRLLFFHGLFPQPGSDEQASMQPSVLGCPLPAPPVAAEKQKASRQMVAAPAPAFAKMSRAVGWTSAAGRLQCCSGQADSGDGEHTDAGLHHEEHSMHGAGEEADREEAAAAALGGSLKEESEDAGGVMPVADNSSTKKEKGARPAGSKVDKGGGKWKSLELGKKGAQIRAGLASEILSEIEEEVRLQRAAQAVAARAVEWEDSLDAVLEPVLAIPGAPSAAGLAAALLVTVTLADAHAWRFIRRPLPFNFLLTPFLTAAVLAGVAGFVALPLLRKLKARQVIRREGPRAHYAKAGTPTMGGLYFVPAGVAVACALDWGSNDVLVACCAVALFGGIGLLDDVLKVVLDHNDGLPGRLKLAAQVVAGWGLVTLLLIKEPAQYSAKTSVQLAAGVLLVVGLHAPGQHWRQRALTYVRDDLPATLLHLPALGEPGASAALWLPAQLFAGLATFCFAAMSNALNLTDGLDGLAAGTAAIAYTGMALAVLPISPALGRFGVAMAGACCGFLLLNRHKAAVFMGDTGSLALGAGLAAMATAAGMFLPLLLISGVFVAETVSVIAQVSYFKWTRTRTGKGERLFRMAPLHHHMELSGMEETQVVSRLYVVGFICALAGACLGIACI